MDPGMELVKGSSYSHANPTSQCLSAWARIKAIPSHTDPNS